MPQRGTKIQNAYEQLKNPSLRSSFSESTQAYQAKWNTNNLGDLSFEDQLMQRTDYSSFFDKIFKHEDFLKFLQLHLSSNYFFRLKTIFQDMDNPALFMYVATASPFLLWSSDNIFINSLGFISPILVASAPFLKKSDIEEMQRFQILLYLRLRQMLIFENKLNFSLLMVDYFDLLVASLESLIQNIKQSNKAEYFNDEAEFKIAFIQNFFKYLLPELTSQNQSLNIYNAFILRSFFKKSFHHISASEREQVFVSNASFWLPHFYNIMSKKELYDLIKNSSEFDTVFFKMKNATNKSLFTRVKNYKNQTCNALFFLNRHNKF